uniref:GrBNV_gp60-like protein n=1 Tax=Nilaparvata lugens endogenous nudivirus TaxID=1487700 RepID=X5GW93_9VIRU|nr:GrBNV_gp60-like protein [Nilaparvata lugens endogenous nudivirus]
MSVNLDSWESNLDSWERDSWESITEQVELVFRKDHDPFFTKNYLDIITRIIGTLLGRTKIMIVETALVLPEPICTIKKYVYLSIPLIALYINQPVQLPDTRARVCKNFNIFEAVQMIERKSKKHQRTTNAHGKHIIDFTTYSNKTLFEDNSHDIYTDTYTANDMVVLVQLYCIVIMIQHWWKHHTLGTVPPSHRNFRAIELAKQKRKIKHNNDIIHSTTDDDDDDESDSVFNNVNNVSEIEI